MLILHNPPATEALYTDCAVNLNGRPAMTPVTRVSAMPNNTAWPGHQRPLDQTELAPMLPFEADEPVTVTVTYQTPPAEVLVRPLSRGIKALVEGNTATLTLPSPGAYTVEADGFHEALHVFYDPITDFEVYTHGMDKVLRYEAGVHHVGRVELFSNTCVILDRDAYVYGSFLAVNAENVVICGHGIIDGSEETRDSEHLLLPLDYYAPIPEDRLAFLDFLQEKRVLNGILRFYRCRNIRVEGVILRDASTFALIPANCEDAVFERVKTVGMWRYNADGIDLFNCRRVTVRACFLRDFDDCIVLKGICGWDSRDMEDILVEGCVTWCDWGRNLELGAETNAPTYRRILFRDCDCIHGSTIFCDIQHHNRAEISDVTFENIRCEYTRHQLSDTYQHDMHAPFVTIPGEPVRHPWLLAVPMFAMGLFSKDGLHGCAHDITFRDIQILTDSENIPLPVSVFAGLDADHKVSRVRIQNVTVNGRRLTREEVPLQINEYTEDIQFE